MTIKQRTRTELLKRLKASGLPTNEYNTNNAWGFGGSDGHEWTLPDGRRIRVGTARFRHIAGEKIANVVTLNEQGAVIHREQGEQAAHIVLDSLGK